MSVRVYLATFLLVKEKFIGESDSPSRTPCNAAGGICMANGSPKCWKAIQNTQCPDFKVCCLQKREKPDVIKESGNKHKEIASNKAVKYNEKHQDVENSEQKTKNIMGKKRLKAEKEMMKQKIKESNKLKEKTSGEENKNKNFLDNERDKVNGNLSKRPQDTVMKKKDKNESAKSSDNKHGDKQNARVNKNKEGKGGVKSPKHEDTKMKKKDKDESAKSSGNKQGGKQSAKSSDNKRGGKQNARTNKNKEGKGGVKNQKHPNTKGGRSKGKNGEVSRGNVENYLKKRKKKKKNQLSVSTRAKCSESSNCTNAGGDCRKQKFCRRPVLNATCNADDCICCENKGRQDSLTLVTVINVNINHNDIQHPILLLEKEALQVATRAASVQQRTGIASQTVNVQETSGRKDAKEGKVVGVVCPVSYCVSSFTENKLENSYI
ncbi:cylicin-2-like [Palaemon carinicauda]|uniref:cylicin-2-like n=1 Tax=Palaemon carinicauda TaxID=392227 RepID=UPI0035B57954